MHEKHFYFIQQRNTGFCIIVCMAAYKDLVSKLKQLDLRIDRKNNCIASCLFKNIKYVAVAVKIAA